MILAADIGGTKCHLALAREGSGEIVAEARYASSGLRNVQDMLDTFLADKEASPARIHTLVLAIAGPVSGCQASLTNLPWHIRKSDLESRFNAARILFINDFQATALGILKVEPDQLLPLHDASPKAQGRRLVMGAGTGMGVAYLNYQNGRYHAVATEAGHISFAPRHEQQWRLHGWLAERYGRVSWERLLSGAGLEAIYAFLEPAEPLPEAAGPAWIVDQARSNTNPQAGEALELFAWLYGSFCGDLALAYLPAGGIYLSGGVTTHITHWLQQPGFLQAYMDKGRMSRLVQKFPVKVVMDPGVGILGAIHYTTRTTSILRTPQGVTTQGTQQQQERS